MSTGVAYYKNAALSSTAALVSVGPLKLFGYHLFNTSTDPAYVQLFDAAAASAVTPGTTTPDLVLALPGSGGAVMSLGKRGVPFTKGLVVVSTTTATGGTGQITVVALFIGID